jgi:hypothetical protein
LRISDALEFRGEEVVKVFFASVGCWIACSLNSKDAILDFSIWNFTQLFVGHLGHLLELSQIDLGKDLHGYLTQRVLRVRILQLDIHRLDIRLDIHLSSGVFLLIAYKFYYFNF